MRKHVEINCRLQSCPLHIPRLRHLQRACSVIHCEHESGEEKVQHQAQPGLDYNRHSLSLMMMVAEGTRYVESPSRRGGLDASPTGSSGRQHPPTERRVDSRSMDCLQEVP